MTPLSRVVIGSLLILAWPAAHAADGQKVFTQGGVGEHFPPLAGQPASYLVAQLNAWRDGTRSNDRWMTADRGCLYRPLRG